MKKVKYLITIAMILIAMCIFTTSVKAIELPSYIDPSKLTDEEKEIIENIPDILYLNKMANEVIDDIVENECYLTISKEDLKDPDLLPEEYTIKVEFDNAHVITGGHGLLLRNDENICQLGEIGVRYKDTELQKNEVAQTLEKLCTEELSVNEYKFKYTGDTSKVIPEDIMAEANKKLILDLSDIAKTANK